MKSNRVLRMVLNNTTFVIFVLLFIIFGVLAPRFFSGKNFENIISSASYIGILAVGVTFVLLTGGIDISLGSNMYLSAVVFGLLLNNAELPFLISLIGCLATGLIVGSINAFIVTKLKVVPFITTLVTMTVAYGFGILLTKSTAVNFPDSITLMSTQKVFGFIPLHIFIFGSVVLIAAVYLGFTKPGRQLYAVGNDEESAKKAGIKTIPLIAHAYMISGMCAALGGFVSITQIGRVNANFGEGIEFQAIAAAILGGASLFGGIGTVFPGTVMGTIMVQMIQAGLIFINVDIYLQPIVQAIIIFAAVLIDSFRITQLKKLERRHIMKV